MRTLLLLALLALSAAPAGAQGIVVPMRCQGACPAVLPLDSVTVVGNLEGESSITYVDHVFRNETAASVDAAFFFPLPRGAVMYQASLYEGSELELYNQWSPPEESRLLLDGILRERPGSGLEAYAGMEVVHVRIPSVPAHGTQRLQIAYTLPLGAPGGPLSYRYPLSVATGAAPAGTLRMVLVVETETGFRDLSSPSHRVDVEWGEEAGRCAPRARCGFTNVPSRRVKVVRMEAAPGDRTRDFELVYTPADSGSVPDPRSAAARP